MVLNILASAASAFPSEYTVHVAISVFVILIIRAFAQGRKTNRERDLHARVVVVTVRAYSLPAVHNQLNFQ